MSLFKSSKETPLDIPIPFTKQEEILISWKDIPFAIFHPAVEAKITRGDSLDYRMECVYGYTSHLNIIGVDRDNIERILWTFVLPALKMSKSELLTLFRCLAHNASCDGKAVIADAFHTTHKRVAAEYNS